MAIFEIMALDDELRELIMQNVSTQVLRIEARKRGMRTLRESGLLAIFDGLTTIDEVVRETMIGRRVTAVVAAPAMGAGLDHEGARPVSLGQPDCGELLCRPLFMKR